MFKAWKLNKDHYMKIMSVKTRQKNVFFLFSLWLIFLTETLFGQHGYSMVEDVV